MTTYLLDVNVLLALSDPRHIHSEAAHQWFAAGGEESWATCAVTENGFIRVASHPSYPNSPGDAAAVVVLLRQMSARPGHQFWSESVSLREAIVQDAAFTHSQVTDLFLLGMAVHHGGKLATFDRRVPHGTIGGSDRALELIAT